MYTVKQVADLYGVTERTVYQWVTDGKLETIRTPGGQIRIPAGSLPGVETVIAEVEDGGE